MDTEVAARLHQAQVIDERLPGIVDVFDAANVEQHVEGLVVFLANRLIQVKLQIRPLIKEVQCGDIDAPLLKHLFEIGKLKAVNLSNFRMDVLISNRDPPAFRQVLKREDFRPEFEVSAQDHLMAPIELLRKRINYFIVISHDRQTDSPVHSTFRPFACAQVSTVLLTSKCPDGSTPSR